MLARVRNTEMKETRWHQLTYGRGYGPLIIYICVRKGKLTRGKRRGAEGRGMGHKKRNQPGNQFPASFGGAFNMNGWPIAAITCPISTGQNDHCPKTLIHAPMTVAKVPITIYRAGQQSLEQDRIRTPNRKPVWSRLQEAGNASGM